MSIPSKYVLALTASVVLIAAILACLLSWWRDPVPLREIDKALEQLDVLEGPVIPAHLQPEWREMAKLIHDAGEKGLITPALVERSLNSNRPARILAGTLMLPVIDPAEAARISDSWLSSRGESDFVMEVIGALATHPSRQFLPILSQYSLHEDILVRSMATYGLVTVGPKEDIFPVLKESLMRDLEVWCWAVQRDRPDYVVNTLEVPRIGYSAASYLIDYGDDVAPFLAKTLNKPLQPVVAADILKALFRLGSSEGVSWCRDNVQSIVVAERGSPGHTDDNWLLYWTIRTLAHFGERADRRSAFEATERLEVFLQLKLAKDIMESGHKEALYDFVIAAAESDVLTENLKHVLVGDELFSELIRERFHMFEAEREPRISGLAAFAVWYRGLPMAP